MQTYKAAVFARNNVAEARNGPSVDVEGISFDMPMTSYDVLYYREVCVIK